MIERISDCKWLQQLHSYGLLEGSFRPGADICVLRSLMRHRENLTQSCGREVQPMQQIEIHPSNNKVIASRDFNVYRSFILRQASGRGLWLNSRPNATRFPTRLWKPTHRRTSLTIRCYGVLEEEAMAKCGWPEASSERIAP